MTTKFNDLTETQQQAVNLRTEVLLERMREEGKLKGKTPDQIQMYQDFTRQSLASDNRTVRRLTTILEEEGPSGLQASSLDRITAQREQAAGRG